MSSKKPKIPKVKPPEVIDNLPVVVESVQQPPGHDTAPAAFVSEEICPTCKSRGGKHDLLCDRWTAPGHLDGLYGGLYYFSELWGQRLVQLAEHAGVKPAHYLEMLVRKQWTAGGAVVERAARLKQERQG